VKLHSVSETFVHTNPAPFRRSLPICSEAVLQTCLQKSVYCTASGKLCRQPMVNGNYDTPDVPCCAVKEYHGHILRASCTA